MIYAIHKKTKEHRSVAKLDLMSNHDWRYIEADKDGWIEWHGGEPPISDKQEVECKDGYGRTVTVTGSPFGKDHWSHCWNHYGTKGDTVAYRPILEEPMPAQWNGPQDGMAPIGERVEIRFNDNDWRPGLVVGHHGVRVIVQLDETEAYTYQTAVGGGVRPIRTPTEIAEERAVEALVYAGCSKEGATDICRAIREGRIPGVKLESQ